MTLCALADIKTMLDITGTALDAKLNLMIKQVSARIASYLGYPVARATYTDEAHAVNNMQLLFLNAQPIQSVSAVTISGVAATDYTLLPQYSAMGALYRGSGWTGAYYVRGMTSDVFAGSYDIKVSYVAGWYLPGDVDYTEGDADSLPTAISSAAMQAVIEWYQMRSASAEGLRSHSEGGISDSWANSENGQNAASGLTESVRQMLTPFVRVGVA